MKDKLPIQEIDVDIDEDMNILEPIQEEIPEDTEIELGMMMLVMIQIKEDIDSYVGTITDIQENEIAVLNVDEKTNKLFVLNGTQLVMKTDTYEIIDHEIVKPFDVTEMKDKDVDKKLTKDV